MLCELMPLTLSSHIVLGKGMVFFLSFLLNMNGFRLKILLDDFYVFLGEVIFSYSSVLSIGFY
jgi:hypothetical protein